LVYASKMTDVGEYTDEDFQEIWAQMQAAEKQTDNFEARLDQFVTQLDSILEQAKQESPAKGSADNK